MRAALFALLLWVTHVSCVTAQTKAVFLNPGKSDEFFWVGYSDFMHAAAKQLDIDLDILYGERESERTLAQVRAIVAQAEQPDYLLLTNENYIAPEVLRLVHDSSMQLFVLHNQLTPEQQRFVGAERERYSNWIGTITSNNEDAGYLTGKALLALAPPSAMSAKELVAIAGSRQTPVSQERVQGLRRAVSDDANAMLRQIVQGDWRADRAEVQTIQLIKRYPKVRLIWTASDEMAFGAMQAMQRQGLVAGKDFHIATMNNSERVLRGRISGEIGVLAAGHFTLGGFGMVMLYDHARGLDFSQHGGVSQRFDLFQLLNEHEARVLLERIKTRDYDIDFKSYSASHSGFTGRYRFSLAPLLKF